jgi:hypothetical protein
MIRIVLIPEATYSVCKKVHFCCSKAYDKVLINSKASFECYLGRQISRTYSSIQNLKIWLDLNLRMQREYSQFKKYRVYLSRMIGNTPYPMPRKDCIDSGFPELVWWKVLIRITTKTFQIKDREIDVN